MFVMSMWLLVAKEIVLTQTADGIHQWFWPKFCWKPTLHDTTDPMKLFLVHTMLFVGSIWKNKSGWFLFVMSLWLLVAKEIAPPAGIRHLFLTQVMLKTNPTWHQRTNETLPCPYNAVCWIHMRMNKSGWFLFVVSLWLLVAARNRADSLDPSLIFWPK